MFSDIFILPQSFYITIRFYISDSNMTVRYQYVPHYIGGHGGLDLVEK